MSIERLEITAGRFIEVLRGGAADGPMVLAHHGTPSGATFYSDWVDDCAAAGLGLIAYSRPGYLGSTRVAGRRVADAAGDSVAVLDALGIDQVAAVGYSGGGPHALAVGALAPDRCRGVAVLAGVAPFDAPGVDFMAGMGAENRAEFGAAVQGREAIEGWMAEHGGPMLDASAEQLAAAFGDLLDESDRQVLAEGWADHVAAEFHRVAASGTDGWVDDDLAFTRPWGFEPAAIAVPVTIWHGALDRMAPVSHSRWLAAAMPGATYHEVPGMGHLAMLRHQRPKIIAALREHLDRPTG